MFSFRFGFNKTCKDSYAKLSWQILHNFEVVHHMDDRGPAVFNSNFLVPTLFLVFGPETRSLFHQENINLLCCNIKQ